ncbi:MAG: type II toxin-antitoxin system YafQ family toxin [Hungatella sp.]|nr:type II toxin-antitoxin system YafQ family toxin [Hungatella sp.]
MQAAYGRLIYAPAPLPANNKDRKLSGNYFGYRECHIAPDWLLIYKQTDTELKLDRTGTHADLFGI